MRWNMLKRSDPLRERQKTEFDQAIAKQSKADNELIEQCEDWFRESDQWMKPRRNRWRLNENLYYGRGGEFPTRDSLVHLNFWLPLAVVERTLPIVESYWPEFDVLPRDENDEPFADQMQRRQRFVMRQSDFKGFGVECERLNLIYGNAIARIMPMMRRYPGYPEPQYCNRIEFAPKDNFCWFPAPHSRDIEIETSRYQIFLTPMHVDAVLQHFGRYVAPEGKLDEFRAYSSLKTEDATSETDGDFCLVKEVYFQEEDYNTYPFGRVVVYANGLKLSDSALWVRNDETGKAIPFEFEPGSDHYAPGLPYKLLGNYKSPYSAFGIGDVELVKTVVVTLNQVMSSLANAINATGDPILKVQAELYNNLKEYMMVPGGRVPVQSMSDMEWNNPASIQQAAFAFVDYLLRMVDEVTGIRNVLEGTNSPGVTSGLAINSLQEAGQARIRLKIEHDIKRWVKSCGEHTVYLLSQYDQTAIKLREEGQDGTRSFFQYDPTKTAQVQGPDGAMTERTQADTTFDIEIAAGAQLPVDRLARQEMALGLYKEGILGPEDVIEFLALPEKQKILDRFKQRNAIGAKMAELEEAIPEFEQLLAGAATDPQWNQTPEAEAATVLAAEHPELLESDAFIAILPEFRASVMGGVVHLQEIQREQLREAMGVPAEAPGPQDEQAGKETQEV